MRAIAFLTLCLFVSGCGKSPLSHHRLLSENQSLGKVESATCVTDVDLCYEIEWQQGPRVPSESLLKISFFDRRGEPTQAQLRKAVLWMPDMGHGSAPTQIEALSESEYLVKKIFFIMPGFWEIRWEVLKEAADAQEVHSWSSSLTL